MTFIPYADTYPQDVGGKATIALWTAPLSDVLDDST